MIAFYIGRNLAISNGREGSFEGMVSVCALICAAPQTVTAFFGEDSVTVNAISNDVTAAKGLFVAMLVGMIAIEAYCKLATIEKLEIKMPDSVPPNVSKSFSAALFWLCGLHGASIVTGITDAITIAATDQRFPGDGR